MSIIKDLEWEWSAWGGQHNSKGLAIYSISYFKSNDTRQSVYCGIKKLGVCANVEQAKAIANAHWETNLSKMLNLDELEN